MGLLENLGLKKKSLASRLVTEAKHESIWDFKLENIESGREFLELSSDAQSATTVELAKLIIEKKHSDLHKTSQHWATIIWVINAILRRKLPFAEPEMVILMKLLGKIGGYQSADSGIIRALENFLKENSASVEITTLGLQYCQVCSESSDSDVRKLTGRVSKALGFVDDLPILSGDVWADRAIADISELDEDKKKTWIGLIQFAKLATGGKPTQKWLQELATIIPEKISAEEFSELASKWFLLVDKPAAEGRQGKWYGESFEMEPMRMHDVNQDILKGLSWIASTAANRGLIRAIAAMGVSSFKKLPSIGPRATRLGNACIYALGAIESQEALAQLALLKVKIKNRGTQNQIAKALDAAAIRLGVSSEEVEEISVPDYGFTDIGKLEIPMGDFTARLEVTGTTSTVLNWVKPDGKLQKSIPAVVKTDFAEKLKELRATAKDVQNMLPAVRERIDGAYLRQQSWTFIAWKERYFDHPLTGWLARRLIWNFEIAPEKNVAGIFFNGTFVTNDDSEIKLTGTEIVRLWHPLDGEIDDALDWRNWLEKNGVQQSFKQAHREIYLLTEAEENTNLYSNRYAAHILKQHQFNALCLARGWKNTLRLMVDDEYPPASKLLESWGIRAEFWVEGIGTDWTTDTTESGTFLYLATDQVRFYPIGSAQVSAHASGGGYRNGWRGGNDTPMKQREVPKLVFSEIMRDCDLFVGVASVGNDPNWADGGPETHRTYWENYSFGDLSNTAITRKQILERLLPKLKIAKQCRIEGRFLVVEGTVRTYKIHLGSGNILMSPSDQYLCIVPSAAERKSGTDKVFLPFEGDNVMAIILSKAFLLAADDQIKDRTIISQIDAR